MKPLVSALTVVFFLAATDDPRAFRMPKKSPAATVPAAGSQVPAEPEEKPGVASSEPSAGATVPAATSQVPADSATGDQLQSPRTGQPAPSSSIMFRFPPKPQTTGNQQPATMTPQEPGTRQPAPLSPLMFQLPRKPPPKRP